jgi:predicted phosphodiesterase
MLWETMIITWLSKNRTMSSWNEWHEGTYIPFMFQHCAGARSSMVSISRCCRTILFTHGHHLGQIQAASMGLVETLRKLSGEEQLPADLEMMMTNAYESIYRSAYIGEMVDFEELLWNVSRVLQRFKSGVFRNQRWKPVERQYEAILKFIRDQNHEKVDCFIYGDTHRAGIYQRKGGPLAVNAGSFTLDKEQGSRLEIPNTYLIMNEDGLALRQLGRKEPIYLCELF